MKNIKALIFDMDGVLVDSEHLHFEAHKIALKPFGIELSMDDYLKFGISGGQKHLYEVMKDKYGIDIDIEAVKKTKREEYGKLIPEIKIIDGVRETLEKLRGNYRMAIASNININYIHQTLQHVGIEEYFEAFSSGKEVKRGKPFPDVYLDAMDKLKMGSDYCIAIENSENGVGAAKSAGIKCIAIPNDFVKTLDFSKADALLKSIREIDDEIINKLFST